MTRRCVVLAAGLALAACGPERFQPGIEAHRPAATYPDYAGATLPPDIAPLNLKVLEPGRSFRLRVSGAAGSAIEVFSSDGAMRIPADAWRSLLKANIGGELRMEIAVKNGADRWTQFDAARNPVSADEIDPYVVYRYIPPIYDKWGQISIRQRDLRSFEERVLFDNERSEGPDGKTAGSACVNCHTFLNHKTGRMLIHSRPSRAGQIPAMIVATDGRARKVDTRAGGRGAASYPAWRPDGHVIAFSRNSLLQIFHTAGAEPREVIDRDSDLGLYDVDSGKVHTVPQISDPERMETWPAWSPDGRYLYFSSARRISSDRTQPPANWDSIQYDLDRVAFDPATGGWGKVERVVSAAELGRSVSQPQVSPDGKLLMFTGHQHGSFPIFQPSADLYVVRLAEKMALPATAVRIDRINSDRSDSWHSWSSNSRWVMFATRREDGVFTRLYMAHVDANGEFGKPFVLPQEDPGFYDRCAMAFNRPELIAEAVTVSAAELTRAMNSEAAGAAPAQSAEEPYRPSK